VTFCTQCEIMDRNLKSGHILKIWTDITPTHSSYNTSHQYIVQYQYIVQFSRQITTHHTSTIVTSGVTYSANFINAVLVFYISSMATSRPCLSSFARSTDQSTLSVPIQTSYLINLSTHHTIYSILI
jgi:hypothetical protein